MYQWGGVSMKYAIVFSSMTGNTAALAYHLQDLLPADSCAYFGETSKEAVEADADVFFVGFWTDQGSCDSKTRVFLKKLDGKTVILFGTAGFGSNPDYLKQVLHNAESEISVRNTIFPGFLCQGKMKPEAKAKFEARLAAAPDDERAKMMLREYEAAASHPNEEDFKAFGEWAAQFIS